MLRCDGVMNMNNPLLTRVFHIPFDSIRAEHVEPAIDTLLAAAQRHIDAVANQTGDLTYQKTLGALEDATEDLEWAAGVIGHTPSA